MLSIPDPFVPLYQRCLASGKRRGLSSLLLSQLVFVLGRGRPSWLARRAQRQAEVSAAELAAALDIAQVDERTVLPGRAVIEHDELRLRKAGAQTVEAALEQERRRRRAARPCGRPRTGCSRCAPDRPARRLPPSALFGPPAPIAGPILMVRIALRALHRDLRIGEDLRGLDVVIGAAPRRPADGSPRPPPRSPRCRSTTVELLLQFGAKFVGEGIAALPEHVGQRVSRKIPHQQLTGGGADEDSPAPRSGRPNSRRRRR